MEGTTIVDCPMVGVYLTLEVTPLSDDATWVRGFLQAVEYMGELEGDLGPGTVVIGLEGWPVSETFEPRFGDVKLRATWDDETRRYPGGVVSERRDKEMTWVLDEEEAKQWCSQGSLESYANDK